jgi:hypothetical protein
VGKDRSVFWVGNTSRGDFAKSETGSDLTKEPFLLVDRASKETFTSARDRASASRRVRGLHRFSELINRESGKQWQ